MIARRLRMNSASKSNLGRLVDYLVDTQGNDHRVQAINIEGCVSDSPDWAAYEMRAVQNTNERTKGDKTYHLVLSFKENLSQAALRDIEAKVCHTLGYTGHQRISVLHGDTDNLHLHICINKIHPARFTMHEPYYDHKKLAQFCTMMEQEYSLAQDNHEFRAEAKETAAKSMEMGGDLESLIGFTQRNCLKGLQEAKSWDDIHQVLAEHGLEIKLRGNGFVISSGDLHVKASSVHRSLSKKRLEDRLGEFMVRQGKNENKGKSQEKQATKTYQKKPMHHGRDVSKLWEEFQTWREEQEKAYQKRMTANLQAKSDELNAAQKDFDLQNILIKYMVKGAFIKRILYAQNNSRLQKRKQEIYKNHRPERRIKTTWANWLHDQAKNGNEQALLAMRARARKQERLNAKYLYVPFADKEKVVELGAKWDHKKRGWYVPATADLEKFAPWLAPVEKKTNISKSNQSKQYLNVPYSERDQAKAAGAKWDGIAKSWYVGENADMTKLEPYLPGNRSMSQAPDRSPEADLGVQKVTRKGTLLYKNQQRDAGFGRYTRQSTQQPESNQKANQDQAIAEKLLTKTNQNQRGR